MKDIFGKEVKDGDLCISLDGNNGSEVFGVWKGKTIRVNGSALRTTRFILLDDDALHRMEEKLKESVKRTKEVEEEQRSCTLSRQKETTRPHYSTLEPGRLYKLLLGWAFYLGVVNEKPLWLRVSPWSLRISERSPDKNAYGEKYVVDKEEFSRSCTYNATSYSYHPYHTRLVLGGSIKSWKRPSIISSHGKLDEEALDYAIELCKDRLKKYE